MLRKDMDGSSGRQTGRADRQSQPQLLISPYNDLGRPDQLDAPDVQLSCPSFSSGNSTERSVRLLLLCA